MFNANERAPSVTPNAADQTVMFIEREDGKVEYPSITNIEQADDDEEEAQADEKITDTLLADIEAQKKE